MLHERSMFYFLSRQGKKDFKAFQMDLGSRTGGV